MFGRLLNDCDIGSRIVATIEIETFSGYIKPGDEGTILVANDSDVGIRFDKDVGGHNLSGRCTEGHGWFFSNYPDMELEGIQVIGDQSEPYAVSDEMLEFLSGLGD